ncbi:MAG: xylulokinase [Candidatus Aminicenantes bacterium]|nr:xylulokinase [Candidatus Aminicenantes bacterium]
MHAIGVDSGTQGTKVLIVEAETGAVVGRGAAPHRMVEGLRPGENEQSPSVWVEAFDTALREALGAADIRAADIAALGVSGQQHGFVPVDKDGRPVRPAKLWNDTSTMAETEDVVAALGGPGACVEKLGIGLAVGFTASKILWLKRHEPANYARLATVLLPHNYLNFVLTGVAHMEYGDASGTGLMDIRSRTWNREAIEAVDPALGDKLPPLSHPGQSIGVMKKSLAASFGLGEVLVAAGGGDNMMGAIGSGNVTPGVCTASLGTSGTVYAHSAEPFVDPAGEIAAFCDSTGGWLPLLCTMNVTNTTELYKAMLKVGNAELEMLAGQAAPGADGLLFLPFIEGERVPVLPAASGVFFGLTKRNFNLPTMARSILEGTVFNLGYGFARMKSLGLVPAEIRATGGGARSALWLQILADILETPVATLEEQEAAAYGAALQAIWSYHRERGGRVRIDEVTGPLVRKGALAAEPQPGKTDIYRPLQERFNSLWKTLDAEFRAHRRILR